MGHGKGSLPQLVAREKTVMRTRAICQPVAIITSVEWYRSKPCIASFLASVSLQLPGLATVTACCLVVFFFFFFFFVFVLFLFFPIYLFVACFLCSWLLFCIRFLLVCVFFLSGLICPFFGFIILVHVVVFLCLHLLLFAISPLLT